MVAMGLLDDYSFGWNDLMALWLTVSPLAMVLVARVTRGSCPAGGA